MIRKAIFPVAGLGTRFLPATKAQPKEMLAVVDKPLIQYAAEEAVAAGATELIFITGRNKRAIEDHFDTVFELESELNAKGKTELLEIIRSVVPSHVNCIFIRQHKALGLGHAVLCARSVVGDEPFAVLLADDLMEGPEPILSQMAKIHEFQQCSVLAVQAVAPEDTRSYGMVAGKEIEPGLLQMSGIVEKPAPEKAPSNLGVAGRYILSPAIFELLANQKPGVGGEIQLTDGIAALMKRERVLAYQYEGQRFDCGSKLGFLKANVELGMRHPEVGADFTTYLKTLCQGF
ncbi:MAG: UTP--glucose-1-phosphate uridylyltransferase GalU [Gammaproteobacteria bacterium]|nr:UTP--glucose-1-phosphate uridylyltransferase GalU [Gammaproteobacteria bacterium]MBU0786810.1 UTP--glucose-1-phosphate uridylyltransferase GalU [Gammaproteobacteria bacterium]MBU0813984.1 UTP--glucose-1-phosphate uridylyltransferase GalU [Gammaproteobacteria bacterium]MBU1788543.1 UTP--glucose-1-phosphate uridylyltransferase GalU [Gammaproteobacteria bacterium]